jgi:predicted nucleic acid-binding protein
MKRALIDTMIVTRIADTPGLVDEIRGVTSCLQLLSTHLTRNQLEAIEDVTERQKLLTVYHYLPKEEVATVGIVLDVSSLGEAKLGSEESSRTLDELTTKGGGGIHDALIALTATHKADVLVTDDDDLKKKAMKVLPQSEVWTFRKLVAYVGSQRA